MRPGFSRKNNRSLRIGFLIQFQKKYGEDGIGFLFLPGVINPFEEEEIIYYTGKVSINFKKDSLKAIDVFFPQLKRADIIYSSDVMSCSFSYFMIFFCPFVSLNEIAQLSGQLMFTPILMALLKNTLLLWF